MSAEIFDQFDCQLVMVNKDFFDGLSAEHQAGFLEAIDEGAVAALNVTLRCTDEAMQIMRDAENIFVEPTAAQRQEWVDATVKFAN
jgi:TRAP-type C4-dicarboxylate transport system substrate-binding protein